MKINSMRWGSGKDDDYSTILDHYSLTKTNSIKTSSIPLAQDWKDARKRLDEIAENTEIRFSNPSIYFEYPTKSYGKNRASMSDIMLVDLGGKVAIEGKFTEYDYSQYQKVGAWLDETNRSENRKNVLNHWLTIIGKNANPDLSRLETIPIQFLHRTASACFESPGSASVIYQVYWDRDSKNLATFENELSNAVAIIRPRPSLNNYINEIEVTKIGDVELERVFDEMKERVIYTFGSRKWISLT